MNREQDTLWYRQPAARWNEALPIGNGKLAAMVWGGAIEETIQIDDSTFWSGCPAADNDIPGTPALVKKLRQMLLAEDYEGADMLGRDLVGNKRNYGTHMPAGNLTLRLGGALGGEYGEFMRALHLRTALAETAFTLGGTKWRRSVFASHPAGVVAVDFAAEDSRPFTVHIRYDGICSGISITGREGRGPWIRRPAGAAHRGFWRAL